MPLCATSRCPSPGNASFAPNSRSDECVDSDEIAFRKAGEPHRTDFRGPSSINNRRSVPGIRGERLGFIPDSPSPGYVIGWNASATPIGQENPPPCQPVSTRRQLPVGGKVHDGSCHAAQDRRPPRDSRCSSVRPAAPGPAYIVLHPRQPDTALVIKIKVSVLHS